MVDLPGYGYAKVSRDLAGRWMKMIGKYLDTSKALRVVFLLVDSRHDPTKQDIEMYHMLFEKGFNPLIIATKTDKLKKSEKARKLAAVRKAIGADPETPVLPFSAHTKEGRDEIWEYIDYFVQEITVEDTV